MQAVALAGGWNAGGNLRQIVVLRRDENWRLMALRLDLAGGLHGERPWPSDEIWLRDSDVVLVPKQPIQRLADVIDLYFTRTLYGVIPSQFAFDEITVF
jgi:polysaccharide export outer membrane protein